MAKFLAIGNAVLDTIFTVEQHPKEDQEIRAIGRENRVGGNVNNMLYILNQLGHEAAICSTSATDAESKQLIAGMQERGIDCTHIQKFIQGSTPNSIVTLNAHNGSRTIVHYRDLPEVSFDFFAKIEIEEYDWLHFEGRNVDNLQGMLNISKTFLDNQPISMEVEKPRENIESLFHQANLIIFSHHYAGAKGFNNGEELLNDIAKLAPNSQLVCTWGAKGVWYKALNAKVEHLPALPVNPVVDTLGAGDTFNAGLLHKLSEGASLSEACEFANHLAAQKIQKMGLDDVLNAKPENQPIANIKQLSKAKATVIDLNNRGGVILIKQDEEVRAYENNCPHQNVPLNEAYKIDVNPFDQTMKCSVHDAFFKIDDGECVEGPCWGEHLTPVSIRMDDQGDIYLI
ncbi:PfkB family carbohydrate kinase [Thiomicrorhabdus sp. 6S3-12]|uniref:PfkB family carbohydrate kinase n=1 Tax=Thiomicrorhabdus sp. 6S3-12 TaxID=2819681 RepID=UPI001AADBA7A|nr:PfkB family carbohydrate kinase [Thiomicrorhabdus sp. 6S3-12]MBO1924479.1 Rieske 2Fe-2S domain-containing protein [Thiomicrorhabdus sp. 6S3-12]